MKPVKKNRDLLKSAIKLLILEIKEKQEPENFDFEFLKKELKSKDWEKKGKAIDYAKDKLKELGQGSSRVALLLPDNKQVLKIAENKAGIAQNKQELQIYLNPSIAKIYTDLYKWDTTGMWLLTEYVKPFSTEEAFAKAIDVPNYNTYHETIADFQKWLARDLQELKEIHEVDLLMKKEEFLKKSKNKTLTERDKLVLEGEFNSFKIKTENKIENINLILNNEKTKNFITKVINLIQRGLVPADLHYNHFGLSANNEIKLYDYGYSIDVWKKFYKKNK